MNNNLTNNNGHLPKVKPENRILPFPAEASPVEALTERVASLENTVALQNNTIASLQALIAGLLNRENALTAPEAKAAPESRPLPEEDKTLDRLALCSELVRVLIGLGRETVPLPTPKLWAGDKKGKPRVYIVEDSSYLFFDSWGCLCAEKAKTKKNSLALRVLKILYQLRDNLPSPVIQAALLKSQYNAALLANVEGLPE